MCSSSVLSSESFVLSHKKEMQWDTWDQQHRKARSLYRE
jgi:hypothetical protein